MKNWPVPYRIVGLQAAMTVLVAVIALAWSVSIARDALLGGVAAFVPNGYFAWRAMRVGRGASLIEAKGLFARWVTKLVMMAAIVVVSVRFGDVGGSFFVSFAIVLTTQVIAPLLGDPEDPDEELLRRIAERRALEGDDWDDDDWGR